MDASEAAIATLQRYVDDYAQDVNDVHSAVSDETQPLAARRLLVGALNYVLDVLDMLPDHYKGLGVADDAMVLRLAAAQAVAAGATDGGVKRLAADAAEIEAMFPSLASAFGRFVTAMPDRAVNNRTADRILADRDTRVLFNADIARETARHKTSTIELKFGGAAGVLKELEKMLKHGLKRAGFE